MTFNLSFHASFQLKLSLKLSLELEIAENNSQKQKIQKHRNKIFFLIEFHIKKNIDLERINLKMAIIGSRPWPWPWPWPRDFGRPQKRKKENLAPTARGKHNSKISASPISRNGMHSPPKLQYIYIYIYIYTSNNMF